MDDRHGNPAHNPPAAGGFGPRFPFTRPAPPPTDEWVPFLSASYAEHRFANRGPLVRRLEAELGVFAGADREAVLVSSATAGLVAALLALDVRGPVAMPAFTFAATAHAVELAGCSPVLCDVDSETWELDPQALASAVRDQGCAAIVHVRALGMCRDVTAIEAVAKQAGIPLVIDSAAAFGGGEGEGSRVGNRGDAEVFSFHATKPFAIGEGGVVLAPAPLADPLRRTINFSISGDDVTGRGLNAKLSEVAAAVGLAMLRRFEAHIASRRAAAGRLTEAVEASGSAVAPVDPGAPAWQCLPVSLTDAGRRDPAVAALAARGIEARTYYAPGLHRTRAFRGGGRHSLPGSDDASRRILCLPVYADLEPAELEELAGGVEAALREAAPVIMQR